jgi:xylulokinase
MSRCPPCAVRSQRHTECAYYFAQGVGRLEFTIHPTRHDARYQGKVTVWYLLMRCFSNGAAALNRAVGADKGWKKSDWQQLEDEARAVPAGSNGHRCLRYLPFFDTEPSLSIDNQQKGIRWLIEQADRYQPTSGPDLRGQRRRASLEAVACMIALGVQAHQRAHQSIGQDIQQITVSGGVARNDLMCEILASMLGQRLHRQENEEGPALGAAVTALPAHESLTSRSRGASRGWTEPFTVADAVATMVKYRQAVDPKPQWQEGYQQQLARFQQQINPVIA